MLTTVPAHGAMKKAADGRGLRRSAAVILGAALVVGAIAGCSSSAGPQSGSAPASIWVVGNTKDAIMDPSLAEWNAAHPDSKLESSFLPSDEYKTKIRTAIAAGAPPTLIFSWGGDNLRTYAQSGTIVDLTQAMDKSPTKFLPAIVNQTKVDNKMFAVPISAVSPVVLYFNKKVLEQAGVAAPKSWDDLLVAIPKLKAAGVIPIALAGAQKWTYMIWEEYLVDRLGGPKVFQSILSGEKDAWSNPAILKANSMIADLVNTGAFGTSFASVSAPTGADAALVYTGKAAILLQGAWVYSTFLSQAPDFTSSDLGFTSFPAVSGGAGDPANVVGVPSTYLSVSAKATKAEQVTATGYLANGVFDKSYTQRMVDVGTVPPVLGVKDMLTAKGNPFAQYSYGLTSDAPNFQASWDQELPPGQATPLLANLDLLFAGKITSQEFSDAMNKTIGAR